MAEIDPAQAFLQSLREDSIATSTPIVEEPAAQKPKIVGGFIDDDEEDDDEEYDPGASFQETGAGAQINVDRGTSSTPQQSVPQSPASAVVPSHSSKTVQTQEPIISASVVPLGNVPVPSATSSANGDGVPVESAVNVQSASVPPPQMPADPAVEVTSSSQSRLPLDRIGLLEDRVKEDPRGDIEAWLSLISEHKKRNKVDEVRGVYDRFFAVFPQAAEQWDAYASMELDQNEFYRVEQIFGKSLLATPSVQLWSTYLNYVRRRNVLTSDSSGNARQTVNQTYDFVLQTVGIDKDSGPLWQDYIQFLRSGPGTIGGNNWQDQQKMDSLRKAYQRAICIPTQAVNALWKEYDAFEMGLNKTTGRKFLQEKSPSYMTARSSNTALQNLTRELNRSTLPILPPLLGFEGDVEYLRQVDLWKQWIAWEKDDPLVLKDEDEAAFKARILYVYKQAVITLRFWPEMWCDAADYCFANSLETEGNDFLTNGAAANPESCLLAFKRADRIESTTVAEEGEEALIKRGKAVREPYDKVLDALYELINKVKEREVKSIARVNEAATTSQHAATVTQNGNGDDDDNGDEVIDPQALAKAQIEGLQKGNEAQTKLLSRTISFIWIALMRAMRRIQGKGKVGEPIGGSRQIFTDARGKGRITSDVYVASALIEHHCYKDPAATKIFERGMKLFKDDEQFALEYLKHLIAINDTTNARAVFETTVNRLSQKPENIQRAKPLYAYFHDFEARYGELSQIAKLEQRMKDLYPEDPALSLFASRFTGQGFDPTALRPIISPATQARPKVALSSIEQPQSVVNSPRPSISLPYQSTLSPKRPLEDSDNESIPPRKVARGQSPLKGAAGRRLNQKNQTSLRNEIQQNGVTPAPAMLPPPPLPQAILVLLSAIPRANTYNAARFDPERMVNLLRNVDLSKAQLNRAQTAATPQASTAPYQYPPGRQKQHSSLT